MGASDVSTLSTLQNSESNPSAPNTQNLDVHHWRHPAVHPQLIGLRRCYHHGDTPRYHRTEYDHCQKRTVKHFQALPHNWRHPIQRQCESHLGQQCRLLYVAAQRPQNLDNHRRSRPLRTVWLYRGRVVPHTFKEVIGVTHDLRCIRTENARPLTTCKIPELEGLSRAAPANKSILPSPFTSANSMALMLPLVSRLKKENSGRHQDSAPGQPSRRVQLPELSWRVQLSPTSKSSPKLPRYSSKFTDTASSACPSPSKSP